jgi:hypothetical protein
VHTIGESGVPLRARAGAEGSSVEPASLAEKSKLADGSEVGSGGADVIDVLGAIVSTVTVREFEAVEVLPAASVALAV